MTDRTAALDAQDSSGTATRSACHVALWQTRGWYSGCNRSVAETKQIILNEITDLLRMRRWTIPKGKGSSLPSHVFAEAARQAGTRTGSMPVISEAIARKAGVRWLPHYDSRRTPSAGGSTVTQPGLRALADALAMLLNPSRTDAYLLTWNPANWEWPGDEVAAAVDATSKGQIVASRWSTGSRTTGIADGDRAFLMKQGAEPRGIVASGHFRTGVVQDDHWDDSPRIANYADVDFDTVLNPADVLPIVAVQSAAPGHDWEPQGSGTVIPALALADLEPLWAQHVASLKPKRRGQARQLDAERRKKVEDAAQERLMQHYRDKGWAVEDTRVGNPFDARATKNGKVKFLEAKGTTTDGASVIVTRNEVKWALDHPGACVLGIWSGIRFLKGGEVDASSGDFCILKWDPDDDDLEAISFDWFPPSGIQVHP